ncbi:hypothetical protein NEOLEDRAFT_1057860 [Neolentinus lepideus HHB14362 ss-1]|uniref:Golgi apparatus membrane protein TVP38 n=1 Tax=Neolentinus lepideus HHB14362 ss-1 TaxID=1314782 RepID=A0A165UVA7_9AGAM|nr:hypothetical protein NEOLEDRAFT_1057860 [Neolentinus lepideus HHB14362 ss-1]
MSSHPYATQGTKFDPLDRYSRTPSPTPSERSELRRTSLIDWGKYKDLSYWKTGKHIWYLILVLLVVVIVILSIIFHSQIVNWLQPFARWMHALPAGFLIPIAIFFVISFPPLFGQEILAVLCGLVWGLGPGFAIVAAGTLLGEWGNFYAFKFCCRARAEKMEKTTIAYAALAKAIRDGGFVFVVISRYSVIPGHLTTALFSTCGIGFFTFTLAAILSLPKQFVTVYMGVLLEKTQSGEVCSQTNSKSKAISAVLVVVTTIITIFAMRYMRPRIAVAKEQIIYARRKARFVPDHSAVFFAPDSPIIRQAYRVNLVPAAEANQSSPFRSSEDSDRVLLNPHEEDYKVKDTIFMQHEGP